MSHDDTPSHSHLLRSKRNRTSGNDDSVKLPATKKRRSALRRDTFEPLTEASLNESADRDSHHEKTNGTPMELAQRQSRPSPQVRELTLRGAKKHEKTSERGIGLLTLSANDFYTVSQLPALPEQIRARPTVAYSCVISPENDYVLALTHTDALVWSYNASASTPTSRELLSFKLPFPPATTEDPLPLAAFTSKSANGEPGIVVVSPKWGKIVYWETLTSATSYAPSQSANGVQGSIPGMFSGELVEEMVPAEPAGFILSLASGRVAQLTVRDQVGRPGIGVQFMRKSQTGSVTSGIFGSIRNAFVGDRRKGTAITRPGRVARAQRDVLVCTEDGEMEFWTNNLLTGNHLSKTVSLKDQLLAALELQISQDKLQGPIQFKIVDFCLATTPASHDLIRRDDADSSSFTILVALSDPEKSIYYLLETTIAEGVAQVRVAHPIRCYSDDIAQEKEFRPRICIPPSSATAFVLFEKAIVVMSVAKIAESPSSQLVVPENGAMRTPFQDCIRLQDNTIYRMINFAGEEQDTGPSCVLAIQGFGIARIMSHMPNDQEVVPDDVVSKPGAKSRIEQAIFFGTKQGNPLDLRRSYRNEYTLQEIRAAVLILSRQIVSSKSTNIPKSSSSSADHLQLRGRALRDLIEYVSKMYPDCLEKAARFQLLWHAEKIAAAQALWKEQEKIQSTYPRKDERDMTYLEFTLRALSQKRQAYPKPEKGETDRVRHWLIRSTDGFTWLLEELADSIKELEAMHLDDPRIKCDYFHEGIDLWNTILLAAFKFREDNASVYGLGNETYDEGILVSGYPTFDSMPQTWTSGREMVSASHSFVEETCKFLNEWWSYTPSTQNGSANSKSKKAKQLPVNIDGDPYDAPSRTALRELANQLPKQVDVVIKILKENHIQQKAQVAASDLNDELKSHHLRALDVQYRKNVQEQIEKIAPYNRDGSIALAETQKDTALLVRLNLEYLGELSRSLMTHPDDERAILTQIRSVQDHVETYFDRFGNDWAYAHFSSMIGRGELGKLIGEGQIAGGKKQRYITWFFDTCSKKDVRLGKIAWINNIVGENKYDAACQTLETVADTEEADIWSRKTEICLAKLAGLAALENGAPNINETKIDKFDCELEYLHIIEALADQINATLYDAIDDEAAVQLAVERYIPKNMVTGKKSQQQRKHLSETIFKLVTNQMISLSGLVDALTLLQIEPVDSELDVDDIAGELFPLALQAIDLAPLREIDARQKNALRKTVWRRLLTKDDWNKLNQTGGKSDDAVKQEMQRTILFMTLLNLFKRAEEESIDVQIPNIDDVVNVGAFDDKTPEDVKAELATIKRFVDKSRLKEHFSGLIQEAKDELRRFRDMEGEAAAQDVWAAGDLNGETVNGHVNGNHA